MPMSKNYTSLKRDLVMSFVFLILLFGSKNSLSAQSLACNGGVNVSMDVNCEAIIDASHILKGLSSINPSDYQVIIKNRDGSIPAEIFSSNTFGGPYLKGNAGTFIKFNREGFYQVTIKRLADNVPCWGDILIEDKLPPFTQSCPCPANSTVVGEKCIFSCGSVYNVLNDTTLTGRIGVNPEFRDNCGNRAYVEFIDDLKRDTACGTWTITRTWRSLVADGHGKFNYRDLNCTQKFYFEAADATTIHPPKKIVMVPCGTDIKPESLRKFFSDTSIFSNPNLDSAITYAYPFLTDTIPGMGVVIQKIGAGLQPGTPDDLCKTTATYTDSPKIDVCEPYSYKLVRTWHVLNWCTNEVIPPIYQTIKVIDTLPPGLTVKDTIPAVSTNPWVCNADIIVPAPDSLWDNCAPATAINWKAFVQLPSGTRVEATSTNNYTLSGLRPGTYDVFYMVTDPCGNSTMKKSILRIRDEVKPVAISKYEIVVTFSQFGNDCTAKIFAQNINSGSFDACDGSMLHYSIKRMGSSDPYGEFVKFSQADIMSVNPAGVPFGIVLVELRVTDKSGNFNLAWTRVRLEDKNMDIATVCGDTLVNLACTMTLDTARVRYRPSATLKGCSQTPLMIRDSILSSTISAGCNSGRAVVGYYIEGTNRAFCTKTFIFGENQNFAINWPPAEIERSCNQTNYGEVSFTNPGCRQLIIGDDDIKTFQVDGGGQFCKKLVRTITVIDWCRYVPNSSDSAGLFVFRQVIKIKDDISPIITCEDKTVLADEDCSLSNVELEAMGIDSGACGTGLVHWQASIDTDNNGTYDLPMTIRVEGNRAFAQTTHRLRAGSYNVRWRASDECGNVGQSICRLTVVDQTPPAILCLSAISTAVMNTNGTVSIWANDFELRDQKTSDNCGGPIRFSFSGDSPDMNSVTISCEDIADGVSQVFTLQVFAWDESGNRDFCTVFVRVDDNFNRCPNVNISSALIAGSVMTPSGEMIESAKVSIAPISQTMTEESVTGLDGVYAFGSAVTGGDYEIKTTKLDDPLNGVSTLDIILIQRHILNIQGLDSPYKVIAADINGDRKISAIDLVTLKRVLLGIQTQMPDDISWRFVRADQEFDDIRNPWPLMEKQMVHNLQEARRNLDFIAIKIGDVNGNAVANSSLAKPRSTNSIALNIEDRLVQKGIMVEFDIVPADELIIAGGQLSLRLVSGQWLQASSTNIALNSEDYAISKDRLTLTWSDRNGVKRPVITVRFMPNSTGSLRQLVYLDERFPSEYYDQSNLDLYKAEVLFTSRSETEEPAFEVFQNKPNPFHNETVIGFSIGHKDLVELSIFDMTGRQLFSQKAVFEKGYNEIKVNSQYLSNAGMLYYQLNYQNQIVTKKMLYMTE